MIILIDENTYKLCTQDVDLAGKINTLEGMEFSRGGGNVWRGVHWQFKSGRSQKFVFNDAFSHFMLPSLRKREKNIYREEVRNNHGILVFLRYF